MDHEYIRASGESYASVFFNVKDMAANRVEKFVFSQMLRNRKSVWSPTYIIE